MSDVHDPNFGKSFLTLGWEVGRGQDPRYWLSELSSPGKQSANDLVRIPAQLVGAHTAIIAQSGSGKSFFLGRLIEELMLQTSARCLVFDPNSDFRRIHTVEPKVWTEVRYDLRTRIGILPHESSPEAFSARWSQIPIRIRTGHQENSPYDERFQILWTSVSTEFFAEELEPWFHSDLYHCHNLVQAFGDVFELHYDRTGKRENFLSEADRVLNLGRAGRWQELIDEFNPAQIEKQIEFNLQDANFKTKIDLGVKRFIESARVAAKYVRPCVQRFYFGKARQYESSGIIRTPRRGWWRKPGHHDSAQSLDVLDLPSFPDRDVRMLAIYSMLTMTWENARRDSDDAIKRPGSSEDVRTPTFVIVDEAHNLIPAETRSKAEIAVREQFRKIIAEGRKYGLFLVAVTQRPDKLDPMILSECENKAVMKLGSASVVAVTRTMLGLEDLAPSLLNKCLEFESGRVLLAGSWCPDGPRICYVAARRTLEGGRSLQTNVWSVPRDVMELSLAPEAKKAAIKLITNHPDIKFFAGRRSIDDCANEMASVLIGAIDNKQEAPISRNVVVMTLRQNILGIEGDLHQQVTNEFRDWLDAETGDITQAELAAWLAERVTKMSASDRDKVSGHLTGRAFDIKLPPTLNPDAVERTIKDLPHLHAFIQSAHREDVWHLHFGNTK